MSVKRLDRDSLYMNIAMLVARRSTCKRAQVGCVLVNSNRVVSTGYNGAPPSSIHCTEAGCIIIKGHCRRSIHAEVNAVLHLEHKYGSLICYSTHAVCWDCMKIMYTAGVWKIVYMNYYGENWIEDMRRKVFPNLITERYDGRKIIRQD